MYIHTYISRAGATSTAGEHPTTRSGSSRYSWRKSVSANEALGGHSGRLFIRGQRGRGVSPRDWSSTGACGAGGAGTGCAPFRLWCIAVF